jgi:hypothetical protein
LEAQGFREEHFSRKALIAGARWNPCVKIGSTIHGVGSVRLVESGVRISGGRMMRGSKRKAAFENEADEL